MGWSRRRSRDERGVVAVEAALVTPLLALMVFGIVEFSLVLRDAGAIGSAVRSGARVASTAATLGPGTCPTGADAPPCTPGSSPALAQLAADAIARAGTALPKDSIEYIMVFKANTDGYPGLEGNKVMPVKCAATANCVTFTWNAASDKFRYANGTWASSSIAACFPGTAASPLDKVGVSMQAKHSMVTGLFGATKTLTDRAILDFEPAPVQTCRAGDHQ